MSTTSFLADELRNTVETTLGAIFVGFAVACCIYGILLSQVFGYFRTYPKDMVIFKIMVLLLLALETLDQMLVAHTLYWYAIENFADPVVFIEARMSWSLLVKVTTGGLSGSLVQAYYCVRVWRFSGRNVWITGLLFILTLGHLGLTIAYTALGFQLDSVFLAIHHLRVFGTVALGTGVLIDIVIAAALCFYLNRLRTGLKRSDSLISSLSIYAINTGVLTSAASCATLLLYNLLPDTNLAFVAMSFVTSKLYAISFFATMNTRRTISGRGSSTDTDEVVTNNTNIFHLGTRMPTVGGIESIPAAQYDAGKWNLPQGEYPPPLPCKQRGIV